eukprot:scaffold137624_cov27-Tisochrysis_lutea.AAC.5
MEHTTRLDRSTGPLGNALLHMRHTSRFGVGSGRQGALARSIEDGLMVGTRCMVNIACKQIKASFVRLRAGGALHQRNRAVRRGWQSSGSNKRDGRQ